MVNLIRSNTRFHLDVVVGDCHVEVPTRNRVEGIGRSGTSPRRSPDPVEPDGGEGPVVTWYMHRLICTNGATSPQGGHHPNQGARPSTMSSPRWKRPAAAAWPTWTVTSPITPPWPTVDRLDRRADSAWQIGGGIRHSATGDEPDHGAGLDSSRKRFLYDVVPGLHLSRQRQHKLPNYDASAELGERSR